MAETYGFYDTEELVDGTYDREYIAQQWADYFKLFIGTGVFASPTNQLKVVAGEGMNIIIKEGWAFIEGRWYHNDADLILPVQPNTTVSTITSGVFIQADSANREIKAVIATGRTTPDRESPYYELELAQIQLETGTTAITDAMITDMRTDETVCGFVKGLLEGVIPTADLFLQFETQFMNWFQEMKDQLSEDAAGHLQEEIDELKEVEYTSSDTELEPTTSETVALLTSGETAPSRWTKVSQMFKNIRYLFKRVDGDLKASNQTAGLTDIPFKFAILDDGSYGYIKKVNGADTPVPFKNPQGAIDITSNGAVDVEDYKTANVSVPLNFTIQFTLSSSTSQGTSNSGTVTIYCRNGALSGGYGSVGSGVNIYSYSINSTATASNPRFV